MRGFAEVVAHLPELLRIRARRSRGDFVAEQRSAVRRRRRAGLQPRARAQAQAPRRAHDPLRQSVGLGVAARAPARRSARASTACSRCFRSSRRSTSAGVPVTFVGHPLAQAAGHARQPPRDARATEARRRRAGIRAAAGQPHVRARDARAISCCKTAAAHCRRRSRMRSFLVPLVTRATRDTVRGGAVPLGLRALPLTLLYGHAERRAARGRRRAWSPPAPRRSRRRWRAARTSIFYRVHAAHRADRPAQAAAAVGRAAQRPGRAASSCRSSCRTTRRSSNLAQAALNLYDDTVTRRRLEALFAGFARGADAPTPARWRRRPWRRAARRAGVAC